MQIKCILIEFYHDLSKKHQKKRGFEQKRLLINRVSDIMKEYK